MKRGARARARDAADAAASAIEATLAALADPTRRAVIERLRAGPRRAGELAADLALTPAGLSRHLRVLRRSGLIDDDEPEHDARVRLYRLQPRGFAPLRGWLDELEAFWADQLQAFKSHAEAPTGRPARKTAPKAAPEGAALVPRRPAPRQRRR